MNIKRRCKAVRVTDFTEVKCSVADCTTHPPRRINERTYWAAWCDDECGLMLGAPTRTEARRLASEENERHAREVSE